MNKSTFIDPLLKLLESDEWVVQVDGCNYSFVRDDPFLQLWKLEWKMNIKDRTISKISNYNVMSNIYVKRDYNKNGKSKSKKLYIEQYNKICSYLIKRKLLDNK